MITVLFVAAVVLAVRGEEECGKLPADAIVFPWQVGIYIKRDGYKIEQGTGSLVSQSVFITATNAFWEGDKIYDYKPEDYFVIAGNVRLPYIYEKPVDSMQLSNIKEIHVVPGFQKLFRRPNFVRYYANDLAVVIVTDPFQFNKNVMPVCLSFNSDFEQKQLRKGAKGTVYAEFQTSLKNLLIEVASDCVDRNITDFFEYRTDKICTHSIYEENGAVLCYNRGPDRGTGLVLPSVVNGNERYYLFGVYSYAFFSRKQDDGACFNGVDRYEFTSVQKHESFIRQYWNESWAEKNPSETGKCVLPLYPEQGSYLTTVNRIANASGGEGFVHVILTVSCRPGYSVLGSSVINCFNGFWPESLPTCVRMCELKIHPSVEYRCLVSGAVVGSRPCLAREPPGTLVSPQCREPNYYSASTLPFMRCSINGNWDYIAKCMPECGTVTADGSELVFGGQSAKRGELPWHAGIYSKTYSPYMQVCGGSIISNNLIISAAHCFWTDLEKQLPASQFAVAVGKLYRPWNDTVDDAQKSDVKEIRLPPRFQGASSNFQDDIAVVIVAVAFEYKIYVRPVCLSFDYNFDRLQLQTINKGKVAGWGLTGANGKPSSVLQVIELPYVNVATCIANSPRRFLAHITSDKICAGTQKPNSALCKGDSGGGLAFPASVRGTERYYLRGVVSTAPKSDEDLCNTATYTSFTHILKHEDFIKQFLAEA